MFHFVDGGRGRAMSFCSTALFVQGQMISNEIADHKQESMKFFDYNHCALCMFIPRISVLLPPRGNNQKTRMPYFLVFHLCVTVDKIVIEGYCA